MENDIMLENPIRYDRITNIDSIVLSDMNPKTEISQGSTYTVSYMDDILTSSEKKKSFKYNEDRVLRELNEYITKTYGGHYGDRVQAQDLIVSSGHGEGFYIGNIIKYASRYGKKNGHNKDDLMKVLHYAVLAMNHYYLNHEKDQ